MKNLRDGPINQKGKEMHLRANRLIQARKIKKCQIV